MTQWQQRNISEMGPGTTAFTHHNIDDEGEHKTVVLPKQLEAVSKASEFARERHRWNTNEEIASLLIAFDKHKEWQSKEIKTRSPSGSMILYSRKKVRYRKDGYCWKKRKDGKTTREDHMKLKVQGVECIYGCYVHSAILPTFHRRCYWLLHNPDIVLVHYLNVPLTDDLRMNLPTLQHCTEKKEWTKEELHGQLRPMFASALSGAGNTTERMNEETIKAMVEQLVDPQLNKGQKECHCVGTVCDKDCKNLKSRVILPKSGGSSATVNQRLVSMLQGQRGGNLQQAVNNQGTSLIINSNGQPTLAGTSRQTIQNMPFILNLSQLQGSNGLIILSSQGGAPISILNNSQETNHTALNTAQNVESMDQSGAQPRSHPNVSVMAGQSVGLQQGEIPGQRSLVAQTVTVNTKQESSICDKNGTTGGTHPHLSALGSSVVSSVPIARSVQNTALAASLNRAPHAASVTSMEVSQAVELDGKSITPSTTEVLAEVNQVKNDLQNFDFNFDWASDEVQKTLSANLGQGAVVSQAGLTQPVGLEGMDVMRTSMVSPHSTDLNLDAFDILDLPDFESDHLTSESIVTNAPSSVTNGVSTSTTTVSSASLGCANCYTTQLKSESEPQHNRTAVAQITDFSPEWSYTEGGVKILVTGPWYSTNSTYNILFDGNSVHATLVQSGVLRCFCPAHAPGLVTLQVACEGLVISNSCIFEYKCRDKMAAEERQKQWFSVTEDQLKMTILERLEEMEKRLTPGSLGLSCSVQNKTGTSRSHDNFENRLIEYTTQLYQRTWNRGNDLIKSTSHSLTLLHCVAALGYSRLITLLIKWRAENPSLVLEYEVDALCIDENACTPLMWACAKGKLEAAVVLCHWNSSALMVCAKDGMLPTTVARTNNHLAVAQYLEQLDSLRQSAAVTAAGGLNQQSRIQSTLAVSSLSQTQYVMQSDQELRQAQDHATVIKEESKVKRSVGLQTVGLQSTGLQSSVGACYTGLFDPSCQTVMAGPKTSSPIHIGMVPSSSTTELTETPPQVSITPPMHHQQFHLDPKPEGSNMEGLTIEIPTGTPQLLSVPIRQKSGDVSAARRNRLLKRISVEVLPDYPQSSSDPTKCPNRGFISQLSTGAVSGQETGTPDGQRVGTHVLRTVNSDPHIVGLANPMMCEGNPMLSFYDRDLNSPLLFNDEGNNSYPLGLDDMQGDTAMETDSPRSQSPYIDIEGFSDDDLERSPESVLGDIDTSDSQMITLANQIIEAIPERIKASPAQDVMMMLEEPDPIRERSSSLGSFSSYSSIATPPIGADDSGISTPLEGLCYEEYRYPDLGTPASSLSPASSSLQSPYSFNLDFPPPTAAEFTAYFNAPTTFMEKDFSQLTLSDEEQRKLYVAAKIIQNFYRKYRTKQYDAQRQRQKEIEAAILIQSYYRRYKQYAYFRRMTQAAVLIQSQFRSYYAQKRFKRSREAATIIQNQYRTYKEHERFKKSRNAAVIIQQRFRNHYQRKRSQQEMARKMQQLSRQSSHSSDQNDTAIEETASHSTTEVKNSDIDVEKCSIKDLPKSGHSSRKSSLASSRKSSIASLVIDEKKEDDSTET